MSKIRIAHLAGPTETIQNTPPIVTSNKARLRSRLPPMEGAKGVLRPQRLAVPVALSR